MNRPIGLGKDSCSDVTVIESYFCPNRNQPLVHWSNTKWHDQANPGSWECPHQQFGDTTYAVGWVDDPAGLFEKADNKCPVCLAAIRERE